MYMYITCIFILYIIYCHYKWIDIKYNEYFKTDNKVIVCLFINIHFCDNYKLVFDNTFL